MASRTSRSISCTAIAIVEMPPATVVTGHSLGWIREV
jgi:hypothetical protein